MPHINPVPRMRDHYRTLGLSSAASSDEIRRAYRILARRYHPDVNPGKDSEETFREIAEAYEILSDSLKRKQYDAERDVIETFSSAFDRAHQAYRKQQSSIKKPQSGPTSPKPKQEHPRPQPQAAKPAPDVKPTPPPQKRVNLPRRLRDLKRSLRKSIIKAKEMFAADEPPKKESTPRVPRVTSLSLLEVPISVVEAITGLTKTVEVAEQQGVSQKFTVTIPAGARPGSVVRLRNKGNESEELIVIIRVAPHPWLSISHRGLTMEIPVTVEEALLGAKIQIPSFGDPLLLTVEPGIQSGSEVRLRGQGITLSDGSRGDLYIRYMIKLPPLSTRESALDKVKELASLYTEDIRAHIPRSILEPKEEHS